MAPVTRFDGNQHKQNFRPTEEDWALLTKLKIKLGLEFAGIVKLALRSLAEKEKL
jgi:hypothetical protein